MQIKIYDSIDKLPMARERWNAIAGQGPTKTIFQTHEWVSAWWETFGHRHRLLHLEFESEELSTSGFACLMASATDGRGNRWHIVADSNSDYCDIPVIGNRFAALDELLRFLSRDFGEWESLSFMNIPEQSPTLAALITLCDKHGLWIRASNRIRAPKIRIEGTGQEIRHKYSVRRHCRRLEKLGSVEFRVLQDACELPRLLGILYDQHIERFRNKGEISLFENPLSRRFYERLAVRLLSAGWLNFSELTLDGKPIAVHFGFEYDRILTWYKPAFDVTYQRYSPGTVLIKYLIDYARSHRFDTLDFTVGDEAFKERFSNATSYNRNVVIYRNRPSAYLHTLRDHSIAVAKHVATYFGRQHASGQRHHTHS